MAATAETASDQVATNTPWTLSVQAEVPPLAKTGRNLVIVIGPAEINEARLTPPRAPGGVKRRIYEVTVYLLAVGKTEAVENDFAVAEEALSMAFATVLVPTFVTDPVTGLSTELEEVGEVIQTTEDQPEQIGPQQSQFEMRAQMRVRVVEIIRA